jgi:putative MATE family efflux protein
MKTKVSPSPALGDRDLTSGSLHKDIWYLAPPMMLETGIMNVSQILDTYWIGRLGSAALAAVTISIAIRWVINSFANGLGIGGMAVVARRIGERDQTSADHATWQTILLGLWISVTLGFVGLAIAKPLLVLLGANAEVLPLGLSFLRIAFAGMFTQVLVFVINAMFRGAGEAGLAMRVLILCTSFTVALEPILVFGFGPIPAIGVAGSALANVIGFGIGVLWQVAILLRGKARISIELRDLKPDFPLMWHILRIALPSTIQMTLRSSSRLVIVGLVGFYGTFATAGFGVANRLLLIALIPGFGLGNAAGTLVGQNMGSRNPKRAERSAWWVSFYSVIYMAVLAVVLFALAQPLISIFDPTPQVVEYGSECLHVVAFTLITSVGGVVLGRAFDGAGNTVPAMAINLITLWCMEIPLAFGFSRWLGLGVTGVWWGRAIANIANGTLFALWFARGKWKLRKV